MDPPPKRTKLVPEPETKTETETETQDGPKDTASTKQTPAAATDDDVQQRRTLFVRSLPYSVTSEALSTKFSFIAPLKHATVVADPLTRRSRGFGFVTFTAAEDARRAVKELHNAVLDGRRISVEVAEPRHRDGAGGENKKRKKILPQQHKHKEAQAEAGAEVKRRAPRLIVRNLPWSVKGPEQLVKIFRSYGKVRNVIIPRKGGRPGAEMCGFAFVTMKGYRNAERAMEKTNGMEIDGRTVAVDWAVEKDEWEKSKEGGGAPEEEEEEDEGEDEEEEEEEEGGAVGVLEGKDADDMNDAPDDASDDEGSDLHMSDDEDAKPQLKHDPADNSQVIFIRNLPFTTDDDSLHAHFTTHFGPVRYARTVIDRETERPRGTAFVCFYHADHFAACLSSAPRPGPATGTNRPTPTTLLQDESDDPTGRYTLGGRVLHVTRAVTRTEATQLQDAGAQQRDKAAGDKRRLFLLQEGTLPASSFPGVVGGAERALREASLAQRRALLQANPMLHLSLTRLSVRNLPRSVTAKELKALARRAAVGFVGDVKEGRRQALSREEVARGGDADREAEARRRRQGKGIVRQAKIVEERAGGGRSRGYGFIEYSSHRWALMGLRWLNGHAVLGTGSATVEKGKKHQQQAPVPAEERKKRLIVEFAIENAQVVQRRNEKEQKARERSRLVAEGKAKPLESTRERKEKFAAEARKKVDSARKYEGIKRKREDEKSGKGKRARKGNDGEGEGEGDKKDFEARKEEKRLKAARIIARKRQIKRAKRG